MADSITVTSPESIAPCDETSKFAQRARPACEFCGKRFKTSDGLQSHLRSMHRREPGALPESEAKLMAALGEDLSIVFEDNDLAVVVKPQGAPTQGTGSLARAHWLLEQLRPSNAADALREVGRPVHRLDAATGGLVVMAKTFAALQRLSESFAGRQVSKRYRALVWGSWPSGSSGDCCIPLEGKPTQTRFLASEAPVQLPSGAWVSTLDLWPLTGRTHQLRKHLKAMGTPIVGDRRYGPRTLLEAMRATPVENPVAVEGQDPQHVTQPVTLDDMEPDSATAQDSAKLCLWAVEISFPHPHQLQDGLAVEVKASISEPELFTSVRAGNLPLF